MRLCLVVLSCVRVNFSIFSSLVQRRERCRRYFCQVIQQCKVRDNGLDYLLQCC